MTFTGGGSAGRSIGTPTHHRLRVRARVLKCQMFGRPGSDLLRKRVLLYS
ncbi:hypothetical protein [Kitasatospora sp. NPDC050463]